MLEKEELEIVDVLTDYLEREVLRVEVLGRGYAWLDTGTPETLIQAAIYVETVEQRQGLKISCPEEIALRMGFIDLKQFNSTLSKLPNSGYVQYLRFISAEFA